ncbi:hypothetical protein GCM10020229_38910 [Kitasatospora albolonga]
MSRPFSVTVAATIACSMLLAAAGTASAATAPHRDPETIAVAQADPTQRAVTQQILAAVEAARDRLEPGRSTLVHASAGVTVYLDNVDGTLVLRGDTGPEPRGFCHVAAMSAVSAIGAAVFGAAALAGGITVVGIAISAEAAGALSSALAVGSGVSALVSTYIC